jgi:hypothetical protein
VPLIDGLDGLDDQDGKIVHRTPTPFRVFKCAVRTDLVAILIEIRADGATLHAVDDIDEVR